MNNRTFDTQWLKLIRSKGYTVTSLSKKLEVSYKQLFELAIGKNLNGLTWTKFVELCKTLDISAVAHGIPMFDEDHKQYITLFGDTATEQIKEVRMKSSALKEQLKKSKTPTYNDVAKNLGVHANVVYKWFNGYCMPNRKHISRISLLLGLSEAKCKSLFLQEYKLKHNDKAPAKRGPGRKNKNLKSASSVPATSEISETDSPQVKLRKLMRQQGFMKQKDLADAAGINYTLISKYFNGAKLPSSYTLIKINNQLKLPIDVCATLFLDIYKSKHEGKSPYAYGASGALIRQYKRRKPEDSKTSKAEDSKTSKAEVKHIVDNNNKDSMFSEPIIFLRGIHEKTPYEWDKYFHIPERFHDDIYTAINNHMKKFTGCTSAAISKVIYDCLIADTSSSDNSPKFSELSANSQCSYVFTRLINSGASLNMAGRYFRFLDIVYEDMPAHYTEFDLLSALAKLFKDRDIDFDAYEPVHNTIQAIVEDIKENRI